ncbi:chemotaxis-specific protein-glutamate methyltransferase CheB [Caulobacter sp. KR2-114]|uniref:chemotaxis-specific protein-glutamate methyltransferase CheB n=1 Tax=Caulobacter sp. KR2-114 TaxID=3400912 RepID=UPI003C0CACC9
MIKLLVVDDSPLMRRLLGDLFAAEGDFQVAFARNGAEALAALHADPPDVITLDVQMPEMDGLACLDRIMLERPTPVVMASSLTLQGAAEALSALELGAVDVIAKPSGAVSLRMDEFGPPLVEKVRAAAGARLSTARRLGERMRARAARTGLAQTRTAPAPTPRLRGLRAGAGEAGLVIIGCSTGGPPALDAVLSALPAHLPWPVVIAQHMPGSFTGPLARRLDQLSALSVVEVTEPTVLQAGWAYLARGDADLILSLRRDGLTALNAPADPDHRWHPSVERLMESALSVLPARRIVGVLMTGMGNDGAPAMTRLRAQGGQTIAQSEATSVVWGMPGELVRAGGAGRVEDLDRIGEAVMQAVAA